MPLFTEGFQCLWMIGFRNLFGTSEVGDGLCNLINEVANEFANFERKFETSHQMNISPAEVHLVAMKGKRMARKSYPEHSEGQNCR